MMIDSSKRMVIIVVGKWNSELYFAGFGCLKPAGKLNSELYFDGFGCSGVVVALAQKAAGSV